MKSGLGNLRNIADTCIRMIKLALCVKKIVSDVKCSNKSIIVSSKNRAKLFSKNERG